MKNSNRPHLNSFAILRIAMPHHPEILEYIDPEEHVHYINIAADPGAKITLLI